MLPNKEAASYRLYSVRCVEFSKDPLTNTKNRATLLTMANSSLKLAHQAERQSKDDVSQNQGLPW